MSERSLPELVAAALATFPPDDHEHDELCAMTKRKDPAEWYENGIWVGPDRSITDAL